MSNDHLPETLAMTARTVGADLLNSLIREIKMLPNVWPKLTKQKQDDVIERLRTRVDDNIKMAVHLIAADGRTVVSGVLEQITIKNGSKAVVTVAKGDANAQALYGATSKQVLLVVADPREHTGGMDGVRGEDDQRGLNLGEEHREDDGGGMDDAAGADDAAAGDGQVVDAEFRELPAIGNDPTQEQLADYREQGRKAAAAGQPQSDCPLVDGALCIAWVEGWKAHHDSNPQKPGAADVDDGNGQAAGDAGQQERGEPAGDAGGAATPAGEDGPDELLEQARDAIVKAQRASISFVQRTLQIGYPRAARLLEELERQGVVSPANAQGVRKVLISGGDAQ